ncbi:hypothetical protein E2C01_097381 [Portunus trituberculatus]|uniref:Uncharacterized protein n=1 Tax=Portunus trituberculatus TaxID=210409 RepID=A0A5B7K4P2_PORTR|nr:hypothetical protein [Portunus trituberculatus]
MLSDYWYHYSIFTRSVISPPFPPPSRYPSLTPITAVSHVTLPSKACERPCVTRRSEGARLSLVFPEYSYGYHRLTANGRVWRAGREGQGTGSKQ